MSKKIKYQFLIPLFITAIFIWIAIFQRIPNNILEVSFFDVGQGDSIFIEFNNKQVLIDGGPDNSVLEKLGQEMSFFDRKIDLLILTHPDADHITGLIKVLEDFEIGLILSSGIEKDTETYNQWEKLIKKNNIPLKIAQRGQIIDLGQGVLMKVLWPARIGYAKGVAGGPDYLAVKNLSISNLNDYSATVQLVYNQVEFLLTGDIEKEVENYLINNSLTGELESDVLKVSHHGSKTSSSYNFIKTVNPIISVISVGEDNHYGHPDNSVLERLKQSLIYRTDQNGDIKILTDGIGLETNLER